jgi:hypothetical protein
MGILEAARAEAIRCQHKRDLQSEAPQNVDLGIFNVDYVTASGTNLGLPVSGYVIPGVFRLEEIT